MKHQAQIEELFHACRTHGWMIATAESCTGGLIAAALTEVAGASEVFERGFVTYSNQAKMDSLGVDAALIAAQGAVSAAVAKAMAEGALRHSQAKLSIAVTGIAGPGGGSLEKPVGLVHLACARRDRETRHQQQVFHGNRQAVREQTVTAALLMLLQATLD
ncbi:hypothetical protein JCM17960_21560 [Magnetospira thiophila]